MGWGDDERLHFIPDTLGTDSKVLDASYQNSSLKAYQVGNYASVVLTHNGNSFNVANMRVMPGTFLLIGDFYRNGTVDVAVGALSSFTPKKK